MNDYRVELDVRVTDVRALREAARKACRQEGLYVSDADFEEAVEDHYDPVAFYLQMILDPGSDHQAGYEIEASMVEQTDA